MLEYSSITIYSNFDSFICIEWRTESYNVAGTNWMMHVYWNYLAVKWRPFAEHTCIPVTLLKCVSSSLLVFIPKLHVYKCTAEAILLCAENFF